MTDGEQSQQAQVQQALADAEQARIRHRSLGDRLALVDQQRADAQAAVKQARAQLADEAADVAKLESFSTTRILAALKGDRVLQLERERAEQQAAEYAVATAEARLAQIAAEREELVARRTELGDVEAAWEQALAGKEEWLVAVDPDAGRKAAELSEEVGRHQAEIQQLTDARRTHGHTLNRLQAVADVLGSAKSWSTYDTWLGGGLIADLNKREKLDQAMDLMRAADWSLRRLATELAGLRLQSVGAVGTSDLTGTFDIWFDNIFSDSAMRNRITEAVDRVHRAIDGMGELGRVLTTRLAEAQQELVRCRGEREALLRA